jgi:hypothetical protein
LGCCSSLAWLVIISEESSPNYFVQALSHIVMPNYQFFLVSLVLVLERWGLVSFNQVKFCLESWKKEFQPQKDMVILNSILLIS